MCKKWTNFYCLQFEVTGTGTWYVPGTLQYGLWKKEIQYVQYRYRNIPGTIPVPVPYDTLGTSRILVWHWTKQKHLIYVPYFSLLEQTTNSKTLQTSEFKTVVWNLPFAFFFSSRLISCTPLLFNNYYQLGSQTVFFLQVLMLHCELDTAHIRRRYWSIHSIIFKIMLEESNLPVVLYDIMSTRLDWRKQRNATTQRTTYSTKTAPLFFEIATLFQRSKMYHIPTASNIHNDQHPKARSGGKFSALLLLLLLPLHCHSFILHPSYPYSGHHEPNNT